MRQNTISNIGYVTNANTVLYEGWSL